MTAGIQQDEELTGHYQFWVFQYPTGLSYLKSATDLRLQFVQTVRDLDPHHGDSALSQMVLIGHSMGGLIAKLQVSPSDGELWDAFSTQSIEFFNTDPETIRKVSETLWFEPLPFVSRVIMVATPHAGSTMISQGRLGRLGRSLVEIPKEMRHEYEQLLNGNREVFQFRPGGAFLTSIDDLSPDSPVLCAVCELEQSDEVHLHSIIGEGRRLPDGSEGDGVVSLESAQLAGVESERRIRTYHMKIHQTEQAISEVRTILHRHLWDEAGVSSTKT